MTNPWNNLSAEQFEEFCYHILRLSGFQDLKWIGRKGGDKGRDITATKSEKPLRRSTVTRSWIVQCKHYRRKTPTKAEVLNWLASCHEHNPDRVLLIVSRSLTASFRDWLNVIQREHPFEIHIWDETELATEYRLYRHKLVGIFPSLPSVARPISLYLVKPADRQIFCDEVDEVGFVVMNSISDEDAMNQALEFVSFIKANEVKVWKPKNRKTKT